VSIGASGGARVRDRRLAAGRAAGVVSGGAIVAMQGDKQVQYQVEEQR